MDSYAVQPGITPEIRSEDQCKKESGSICRLISISLFHRIGLSFDKPFFMSFINIEIKARTSRSARIREYLLEQKAEFRGIDDQTDTYFNVLHGRLKLRQGTIENNLIFYERPDAPGPKQSDFDLINIGEGDLLNQILSKALGIRIIVRKKREIYFIGNVKFHLDTLEDLGNFVEIEASNKNFPASIDKLHEQCNFYMRQFGIKDEDLVDGSYSDMLMDSDKV